ncbi:hypothetical protein WMY93_028666 [Mugilogobius chulae]|uniref:Ig-like domain-containing protein n=1 Tax=Mugilogobius chulae TaxID=88201 RepID=A0AAW0MTN0_9GOBI
MTVKHLLIILFCLIVSCQGLLGCDVEVRVRRGTVYNVSPHQHVELKCPVQHCGKTVHVVWCKLQNTSHCENLNTSDHIQIIENMLSDERLESVLSFKRISAEDSGLYSCGEVHHRIVGHLINVSVSGTNQEYPNNKETNPEKPQNGRKDRNNEMKIAAMIYFVAFLIVALLLLTVTFIVILRNLTKTAAKNTRGTTITCDPKSPQKKFSCPVPIQGL